MYIIYYFNKRRHLVVSESASRAGGAEFYFSARADGMSVLGLGVVVNVAWHS